MAIVRDPVDRAVSLFDYITKRADLHHPLRKELQGVSLEQAIEKSQRFRNEIANRQCAMIGGSPTFSAADRSIREREWLIGCYELVDEMVSHVWTKYGWPPTPLMVANVNRRPGYLNDYCTNDTLEAIKKINRDDILLYSLVRNEVSGMSGGK